MTTTAHTKFHHTLAEFDLDHPHIAATLLDPQDMHRMVMGAFHDHLPYGSPSPRAHMGILFTTAVNQSERTLTVIIQSGIPADHRGFPTSALVSEPRSTPVEHTVTAGQSYRFRIIVNPARHRYGPDRCTRDGPTDASPHATLAWFTERLQPTARREGAPFIGATADPETLAARRLPTLYSSRRTHHMIIDRAEVFGELTVTHPHAFADLLTHGLGRFRAYGCGLLLAQPLTHQQPQNPESPQPGIPRPTAEPTHTPHRGHTTRWATRICTSPTRPNPAP
ncbi:type I-E CRISPR-associated protein Cas6/Cse3/CasE [Streptomyces sp. RerS4]|uniref:type I-E CRISPR-associated protein Cas6/Cse3/CasE n=1 Tax=Streptomyces sp. RerS4 TaxID=2942449 RepID=UPI00201C252F|nr:type I-E CRISPR-associated protein Cas6/Cse3/CasE [Streptomyces sp. RerS4]UQW99103.1 type I-E CRISPR-associated protein Cas6/Cse3/CasE [Streptomyces sp. RerS4]